MTSIIKEDLMGHGSGSELIRQARAHMLVNLQQHLEKMNRMYGLTPPFEGEEFYDRNGSKKHIVECFTDGGVEMVTYKFWNRIQKWEYICEERSAFLRHFEDDWRWA